VGTKAKKKKRLTLADVKGNATEKNQKKVGEETTPGGKAERGEKRREHQAQGASLLKLVEKHLGGTERTWSAHPVSPLGGPNDQEELERKVTARQNLTGCWTGGGGGAVVKTEKK